MSGGGNHFPPEGDHFPSGCDHFPSGGDHFPSGGGESFFSFGESFFLSSESCVLDQRAPFKMAQMVPLGRHNRGPKCGAQFCGFPCKYTCKPTILRPKMWCTNAPDLGAFCGTQMHPKMGRKSGSLFEAVKVFFGPVKVFWGWVKVFALQ